ncbi:MAG: hypothetical protein MZV70_17790 [Desulfobacterales bacterium]|nr:hypothetical protein [Desulfobacterales bacterium]
MTGERRIGWKGPGEEGQPVQPAAEDLDWVKGLEQDEQPASVADERSAQPHPTTLTG